MKSPKPDGKGCLLAIESSCDETSAALIKDGEIASCVTASQADLHAQYGGVVPEIASRKHLEALPAVCSKALEDANTDAGDLDCVAVTFGPGLVGALLTGLAFAKGLAVAHGIPIVGVNHMAGHIAAAWPYGAEPPFLALVISGGHTMTVHVKSHLQFEILGSTLDDAAGEAFDKVARLLGFPYPGGAALDSLAGDLEDGSLKLRRPTLAPDSLDFSFSGVKSAVLNHLKACERQGLAPDARDVAASFRACVADVLVEKTVRAAKRLSITTVAAVGGVACNSFIRARLANACQAQNMRFVVPDPWLCSDNAAMIGLAAWAKYQAGEFDSLALPADPGASLAV